MPSENEIIVLGRDALRSSVKARLPQPLVRLRVVMQDRPALLNSQNLRPMKANTDELATIHPRRKSACAVPNRIGIEAVRAGPIAIIEYHPTSRMNNGHRDRDIGESRNADCLDLVIRTGEEERGGATVDGDTVRRPSVFGNGPLKVAHNLIGIHASS